MRISKLYLPAVAMAGAVALAGCGGGSDVTTPPPPPPPAPPESQADCTGDTVFNGDVTPARCDPKPPAPAASLPTALGPEQLRELLTGTGADDELIWVATAGSPAFGDDPVFKESIDGGGQGWTDALNAKKRKVAAAAGPDQYAADLTNQLVEPNTDDVDAASLSALVNYAGEAVKFRGIVGTAHCADPEASDCKATDSGDNIRLTGDWFFIPTDTNNKWESDGKGGFKAVGYAEYGYWLEADGGNESDEWRMHAILNVDRGTSSRFTATSPGLLAPVETAEYEGEAHGASILTSEDDPTKHGTFNADVKLMARFGTNAEAFRIAGTIDGFEGTAVNDDWTVKLDTKDNLSELAYAPSDAAAGIPTVSAADSWTATPYGPDVNQRPTGFIGVFNEGFTDGAVAGVYHAD